ncbi:MAG: sialidase family protein [archaeon]|nr:sialidase family protein [archaeon]
MRTSGLRSAALALLVLSATLSGCFGSDDDGIDVGKAVNPFTFEVPALTFYHLPGNLTQNATDAVADASTWEWLVGNNTPFPATGTYHPIGFTTFEPTIGVTSEGTILITNYGGTGSGTHIIRSQDQGLTWEDVGPFNPVFPNLGQVPTSNDPYIYVDKWTDRIVKFDMHALTAMFVEFSDDEGDSWSIPYSADGYYSPQDHQSIASMPPPEGVNPSYDTVYVFCINTGSSALGPQCSRSMNGGLTWDVQRPGYPNGVAQCSGLHAHLAGAADGTIYRGNPSCEGPAVYRSVDGGYTWTEHTITSAVQVYPGDHEVATAADEAGGLHATWIGADGMIWYANSQDKGDTWSEPMTVAPPGVTGAGFPTVFAGEDGRVAIGYIGTRGQAEWDGFISIMTDSWNEHPLITTVQVNQPGDPLDTTADCGWVRCGGFGDFIDIEIDDEGRPWVALANNPNGEIGIVGTMNLGVALYGDLRLLPELPEGEVFV